MDPPGSGPSANGVNRAATAAAEPPLVPPGMRSSAHGLWTGPNAEFSVDGRVLHGVLRVPIDDVALLMRLDRDLDGQVSVVELDAARYVLRG